MQEKRKENKRKRELEKILKSSLQRGDMSEGTADMIDRLFMDNEDDLQFREILEELFENDARLSMSPSEESLASLAQVRQRLGLRELTPQTSPARKIPLRRRTYLRIASAAAVALVVAGAAFLLTKKGDMTTDGTTVIAVDGSQGTAERSGVAEKITIETVEGVRKEKMLPDSTRVWIDSATRLVCEVFSGDERHVKLEGGAYFDVERVEAKPFIVHTAHLDVRVLGTKFDVRAYPGADKTEVALFEGLVEVICGERTQIMHSGELFTYDHGTREIKVAPMAMETRQATESWQNKDIFINRKTMPELLMVISNYYDTEVVFDTADFNRADLYAIGFDGDDPIEKALDIISEVGGGFRYEKRDGKIYIMK